MGGWLSGMDGVCEEDRPAGAFVGVLSEAGLGPTVRVPGGAHTVRAFSACQRGRNHQLHRKGVHHLDVDMAPRLCLTIDVAMVLLSLLLPQAARRSVEEAPVSRD